MAWRNRHQTHKQEREKSNDEEPIEKKQMFCQVK